MIYGPLGYGPRMLPLKIFNSFFQRFLSSGSYIDHPILVTKLAAIATDELGTEIAVTNEVVKAAEGVNEDLMDTNLFIRSTSYLARLNDPKEVTTEGHNYNIITGPDDFVILGHWI